ncbi:MAG: DUF4476 domain-containing protein [Bacteroidota bacterium]
MTTHLRIILLVLLAGIGIKASAQFSNLIVFTQENEPFTLMMNGIRQNPDAMTNVKITGLKAPSYKISIRFQNQGLPEINKTVYLQAETESTYEILKNNKGTQVMRLMNSIPLDQAAEAAAGQQIYDYTTTPRVSSTTISQTTTVSTGGFAGGPAITTTTTQTTTGGAEQVTMEINHNGMDQNGGFNRNDDHRQNGDAGHGNERHKDSYDNRGYGNSSHRDGDREEYSGPKGCPRPMSKESFDAAVESINAKTFADSKLTIAKQVAGANCLRASQVRAIMKLFTFESDRLEFAKFAYQHTWDLKNYFMVNDAFEFESSVDELNRHINGKK